MSRVRVFHAARTAGNAAWWTFVVAALVNRGLNLRGWDYGWTAYTPLTDGMPRRYADYVPFNPAAVQLVGVPFLSLCLIAYAFGGLDRTIAWSPTAVLVFVLAAIAIRQIWMRRFAPAVGE
ncbi:hypothetical protein [Mycobacteroides chelonae]|uniref:hypothetical protein n=1 Tax=Mycobacteroides chelonae TaxID=1774 RepID=UPI000618D0A9|nr:hypothetical protein [Mycobacteroides chelonae]AKC40087.1 hypothetical protein GR01_18050 [Mycobacteroides chelonae]ANA99677.1 hypothetical protein BB28_18955 [Mycobacteroides chelonae CCUG 47445]OLT82507.1 hypothetical protein BKG56_10705 [Mycobacteroides chelonae]ORV16072.1 hypothetical protein AWB96_08800 [Mycobacteroides chelonae]